MQNQIPLPTDNIFKFYALFGLLLFIFAIGATLYVNNTTNSFLFQAVIDIEVTKANTEPNPVSTAQRQILERRIEIATADKRFFMFSLSGITTISCLLMFYGFVKWHREIQPVQDEIAKLQRDKLRIEIDRLSSSTASKTTLKTKSLQK